MNPDLNTSKGPPSKPQGYTAIGKYTLERNVRVKAVKFRMTLHSYSNISV